MIFIFVCEGHRAEFETYGAQAETTVGFYDAFRSAVIDVTADAVLLRASNLACVAALKVSVEAGSEKAADKLRKLAAQTTEAEAFARTKTQVFVGDSVKGKTQERALLFTFESGLGDLAGRLAGEAVSFAKGLQTAQAVSADAFDLMRGLDSEYDPSILPTSIKPADRIMIDPGETADHATSEPFSGADENELDDLIAESEATEQPAATVKGSNRGKVKKKA